MHLQSILAPTSECRVNELFLASALSTILVQNWLFKIICAGLMAGEGAFSVGIMELFLGCLWSREAQKCPTGKVVMRVGVGSQLGRGELVECQGKWAWVDHKQLSGRQGAWIWQYKEGKRNRMQKPVEVNFAIIFWPGMNRAECLIKAIKRVLE